MCTRYRVFVFMVSDGATKQQLGWEILNSLCDSIAVTERRQAEKALHCCGQNGNPSCCQIPSYQRGHSGTNLISFLQIGAVKDSLSCSVRLSYYSTFLRTSLASVQTNGSKTCRWLSAGGC